MKPQTDSKNIAAVRRLYEARGNADIVKTVLAPDVCWEVVEGFPHSGVYQGLNGVGDFFTRLFGDFEDWHTEPAEIFCVSKDASRRRLEGVERENLNPPTGLRASHEWMGNVSTILEAGWQNPVSDKTPSSSASRNCSQSDELEGFMILETALVRALQRL